MIKDLAWNAFKNTGNINTFLELKQIEKIQKENSNIVLNQEMQNIKDMQKLGRNSNMYIQKVEQDGDNKNKWNNNF